MLQRLFRSTCSPAHCEHCEQLPQNIFWDKLVNDDHHMMMTLGLKRRGAGEIGDKRGRWIINEETEETEKLREDNGYRGDSGESGESGERGDTERESAE